MKQATGARFSYHNLAIVESHVYPVCILVKADCSADCRQIFPCRRIIFTIVSQEPHQQYFVFCRS